MLLEAEKNVQTDLFYSTLEFLNILAYSANFWQCTYVMTVNRALPDITSGPEVRQIFKIRTVWKLNVFLPGRQTFKNRKKIQKMFFFKNYFLKLFFHIIFLFIYMVKCLKM